MLFKYIKYDWECQYIFHTFMFFLNICRLCSNNVVFIDSTRCHINCICGRVTSNYGIIYYDSKHGLISRSKKSYYFDAQNICLLHSPSFEKGDPLLSLYKWRKISIIIRESTHSNKQICKCRNSHWHCR